MYEYTYISKNDRNRNALNLHEWSSVVHLFGVVLFSYGHIALFLKLQDKYVLLGLASWSTVFMCLLDNPSEIV